MISAINELNHERTTETIMTKLKESTNDSLTLNATTDDSFWVKPAGGLVSASLFEFLSNSAFLSAGIFRLSTLTSRLFLKVIIMKVPRTAMANRPAARATVLFIPDAIPECFSLTEAMTAAVRGATTIPIPIPSKAIPGKYVVQYSEGPLVIPGKIRRKSPNPANNGPMIKGFLAPNLSENFPENPEIPEIKIAKGRIASPAVSSG